MGVYKGYMQVEKELRGGSFGLMQEFSSLPTNRKLGDVLRLDDGRVFRLALNGAVALAAGKLITSPLNFTEREDTITVAAAIGATSVTYTAVGTITADAYAGGLLRVVDGTGEGLQYKISGNDAITAAATGSIYLYDPIVTALDTTSDVIITKSKYSDTILAPADAIAKPLGVPVIPVTAAYYFWVQTWGDAICLFHGDAAASLGNAVTERACYLSDATAGAFESPAGGIAGQVIIGEHLADSADAVDTEYHAINLRLDP